MIARSLKFALKQRIRKHTFLGLTVSFTPCMLTCLTSVGTRRGELLSLPSSTHISSIPFHSRHSHCMPLSLFLFLVLLPLSIYTPASVLSCLMSVFTCLDLFPTSHLLLQLGAPDATKETVPPERLGSCLPHRREPWEAINKAQRLIVLMSEPKAAARRREMIEPALNFKRSSLQLTPSYVATVAVLKYEHLYSSFFRTDMRASAIA